MKVCANCFDLFPPEKTFKNLFCSEKCWNQFKAQYEYRPDLTAEKVIFLCLDMEDKH